MEIDNLVIMEYDNFNDFTKSQIMEWEHFQIMEIEAFPSKIQIFLACLVVEV